MSSLRSRIWYLLRAEIKRGILKAFYKAGYYGYKAKAKAGSRAHGGYSNYQNIKTKTQTKIEKYYAMLELKQGANLAEIKLAYIKLVKQYHPDKFQDEEKKAYATELLQKINEAYDGLKMHLETAA